jgi:hypothetical protein
MTTSNSKTLLLRRLKVLVIYAEMAEILIEDGLLDALGLDSHSVLTNKMSARIISSEIDALVALENSQKGTYCRCLHLDVQENIDCRQDFLLRRQMSSTWP